MLTKNFIVGESQREDGDIAAVAPPPNKPQPKPPGRTDHRFTDEMAEAG